MFGKRLALKTKVIKSYSYAHKRSKPNSNVEQTPYAINVDIHQGLCVGSVTGLMQGWPNVLARGSNSRLSGHWRAGYSAIYVTGARILAGLIKLVGGPGRSLATPDLMCCFVSISMPIGFLVWWKMPQKRR